MPEQLTGLFQQLVRFSEPLAYLVLALAAGLENLIPPIPADTVVLFGGFLSGRTALRTELVFAAVWMGNVAGALLVYALGRRFGGGFFAGRWGRLLLRPGQLARLGSVYHRHGMVVIFISRFLPMFRAVVPVFAGIYHLGWVRTAVPIFAASALWYGALVYAGAAAGRNLSEIVGLLQRSGFWLWVLALLLLLLLGWWWWRTRAEEEKV